MFCVSFDNPWRLCDTGRRTGILKKWHRRIYVTRYAHLEARTLRRKLAREFAARNVRAMDGPNRQKSRVDHELAREALASEQRGTVWMLVGLIGSQPVCSTPEGISATINVLKLLRRLLSDSPELEREREQRNAMIPCKRVRPTDVAAAACCAPETWPVEFTCARFIAGELEPFITL